MGGEVVLVAVDASKEITDYALEWAVRNVIEATDSLIFLAILPSNTHPPPSANRTKHSSGIQQFLACLVKKFRSSTDDSLDQIGLVNGVSHQDGCHRITEVCVQMMRRLCVANKVRQVQTKVNVVADAPFGSVATKAEDLGATWVVLDRRLKKEGDWCLKQLNCNIVIVDHAIPKFLKSVNSQSMRKNDVAVHHDDPTVAHMLGFFPSYNLDSNSPITSSSLGFNSRSPRTDRSGSVTSADKENARKTTNLITTIKSKDTYLHQYSHVVHQVGNEATTYPSSPYTKSQPLSKVSIFEIDETLNKSSASPRKTRTKSYSGLLKTEMNKEAKALIPARRSTDTPIFRQANLSSMQTKQLVVGKQPNWNRPMSPSSPVDRTSSIRKTMSISIKQPPTPPPLCSVCKYNAPIFGKPPRKFSYKEIEIATEGFSSENFLAEGGYGPVFRGIMPDGQVVAVKQHKVVSAQGASEFCSEVEVLSCAQHRNLVMLVGYCTEPEWLLVYEFACNGSLDKHLYNAEKHEVMTWKNRMKVAIGAARGLRYLHEDCRVGCIIHRDLRPKNILLTHDFEPMVGDFGLARLQADGQSAEETRVIGAFGYLAPEYTQTGLITEKADVFAFGVVLLELLSGLKATDLSRSEEKQYLPEWCQTLLAKKMLGEIIDPKLEGDYVHKEVEAMLHAASLCISPHPERRPRMSKVLRIIEGDMPSDLAYQHGEASSPYVEHRRKSNYTASRPSISRAPPTSRNYSPSPPIESMHHLKFPSSSPRAYKVNSNNMDIRPATSWEDYGLERLSHNRSRNQNEESVSKEYQTYLQGSLVEFIHNHNMN
ncbi:Inactive protein kinase [Thalictrum thalictroides]|uniref:Inactive protein kinase n=1 Tax=Thalictrum thalictroides TaxID=46969 RepID=A0A7J6X1X5_THATH|nr:Inactive protein kinase [Thalictrum thalictroides]